jgi:hypothetical protein
VGKCSMNSKAAFSSSFCTFSYKLWQLHCIQQASVSATGSVLQNVNSLPSDLALSVSSPRFSVPDNSPLPAKGTVEFSNRVSAPIITVQSLREITEDSMPGTFAASLKVMIDVDAQPAVACISLDESVVNLLSCFAKCYGKGHAQNRRGIILFAATKVSTFRTFVTLRFSVATRSLSYISKPLSLCNDSNFWCAALCHFSCSN